MKKLILISLCMLFTISTALADWDPCDPYKMHFPQLPDTDGWDVRFSPWIPQLADDWLCTSSGMVDDIHLWYSWEDDLVGAITQVKLGIWSNSPDPDGDGPDFSKPGNLLWGYRDFSPAEFTTRHWGRGNQGWYDPISGEYNESDHMDIYQLNIVDIADPFYQEKGGIYWLSVCFYMGDPNQAGWKTADMDQYPEPYTGEHFMDDAVWQDGDSWNELIDPITQESLDLAFVITPEPATIALLGFGALSLIRRKRSV